MQRMEVLGRAQPLDRHDLVVLVHHRQRQAGIDPPPVHQHRARAALAVVATFLGAGQPQMFAAQVEQRGPDIHLRLVRLAIDREVHVFRLSLTRQERRRGRGGSVRTILMGFVQLCAAMRRGKAGGRYDA
ncbi:hypothetical protein SPHINGO8AM_180051 [Sphingomonas sp. 8AM]|nr:hypothetical protein SPHINGO8AM_180051 [Sphingomonas sp. 8AM]